ncbi:ComE operon protein 1 [bacterium HR15]|nr:ComE operon protein 1 [bacterium HR15]
MPSIWEKLDWKEKAWLGAVYGVSLLLTFLVAYNLGRGSENPLGFSPSAAPTEREIASTPRSSSNNTAKLGTSFDGTLSPENAAPAATPVQEIDLSDSGAGASVVVHVAGQVRKPGVYTLPSGSRLRDALQQAGGAKPEADLDGVNLAEPLSDGQKIYVPHKAETRVATAFNEPRAPLKSPARFPLDINRATAEELEQLPGIGPVLAARIVEYRRAHGRFQSVDELLEVRGIGPKRLEQLRPYVIVR